MHLTADRRGRITIENSGQDRLLEKMYGSRIGRILIRAAVSPAVSKLGGRLLDSKASKILIPPFIRSHSIPMEEFEKKEYASYNDFFTRKLARGARRIERDPDCFVSPCDGRLSVSKIGSDCEFFVKHTRYTAESLLRSKKLAKAYAGGCLWIFRLCVDDYHRYIYVDEGKASAARRIPGVFHTVNPAANDRFPIYKENTREYILFKSEHFGTVLQMEVGAMLVGKIENHPQGQTVKRGQEKGNFAFGGSTVILMTEAGKVLPDPDILENSGRGIETKVKLGERVGIRA